MEPYKKRKYPRKKSTKGFQAYTRAFKAKRVPNPVTVFVRGPQFLADRYYCQLSYRDVKAYTAPDTLLFDLNYYRANGMFDPDRSGTGAQPAGFDQLIALYNRYIVLSTKTECTFTLTGSSVPVYGMIGETASSIGFNAFTVASVAGNARVVTGAINPSGTPSLKLKLFTSTPEVWGVDKASVLQDSEFWGGPTYDPSNVHHHVVGVAKGIAGGADPVVQIQTTITFYCCFIRQMLQADA